jgi:hypothetical protein
MAEAGTEVRTVDARAAWGDIYRARAEPRSVEVPRIEFLMVDGHGDLDGSAFHRALEALYAVAYVVKFRVRKLPRPLDLQVMPLEGLWWIPDARVWDFDDKSDWDWTLMLPQPDVVTPELVNDVVASVRERRRMVTLDLVRFEPFEEGRCAQALHRGPLSAERPTLERLFNFIRREGLVPVGKHHEVYLTDPQRTSPGNMRTIVRQPVVPSR